MGLVNLHFYIIHKGIQQ